MQNTINHLQAPTWRWLNINDAPLPRQSAGAAQIKPAISGGEGEVISWDQTLPEIQNLPRDLTSCRDFVLSQRGTALTVTIPKGVELQSPLVIDFTLDEDNSKLAETLHIKGEEGCCATVVVCYRSKGNTPCTHSGFTLLETEKDASVLLIKAQLLSREDEHTDGIAVRVAENGYAGVLLAELGAKNTIAGCNIELCGKGSSGNLDGLYIGAGEKHQDMNYRIGFTGKESTGAIVVKGALAGKSKKIMKSTIDFVTGAAGAKGREEETILTLSDEAVNISAPLLLCGEDNVEGEHATSTGKPDPEKLFYLMSRGLSEREAKVLLVEASFTPILNKIQPEALREEIVARIQEVVHGD